MAAKVTVERNELPAMADKAARNVVDDAAREIAFEVLRRALVHLERQVYTRPNAQVSADRVTEVIEPTGALWNSGYVRVFDGSPPAGAKNEQAASSSARARNPQVTFGQAPPGPSALGQAQVLFAVEYGLYVEMGTMRGMVARPYLRPAAEETQAFVVRFVRAKLREAGFR